MRAQPLQIGPRIFRHLLAAILHHKPGMRQRHDLLKEAMPLIEPAKIAVVLALPQAIANLEGRHRLQLPTDTRQYEWLTIAQQLLIVVIIEVLSIFHEPERRQRRKKVGP